MKQLTVSSYRTIFLFLIAVLPHICQSQVRSVDNKGTIIVADTSKWYLSGQNIYNKNSGNVGINTNTPSANLHVNGFTIIETLPTITTATKSVVIDPATKNLAQQDIDIFAPIIGDIKYSAQSADHNGWILLDGRSIATLNAGQQANAVGLGFAASLPNASNTLLVDNGSAPGSITGSNTAVLAQTNLPNFNFTGTTNTTGNHTHTYDALSSGIPNTKNGAKNSSGGNSGSTTGAAGNHNHTLSFNTGGSGTPISIVPKTLSANVFVYLGL